MQVFHAKCPSCICCVFQTAPGSVVVRTTNSLGRKDSELELNLPEHFWLCDLSNHFLNPAGTAHDDLNVHSLFVSSSFLSFAFMFTGFLSCSFLTNCFYFWSYLLGFLKIMRSYLEFKERWYSHKSTQHNLTVATYIWVKHTFHVITANTCRYRYS